MTDETDMHAPASDPPAAAPAATPAAPPAAANGAAAQPATAPTVGPVAKTVVVKDLNLFYGAFHAVRDVDITIQPNKVTALIGSSGCGKSTFMRSLNRMHELVPGARAEGTVLVDGQDIYAPGVDPVAVRRDVGMVFQQPNPFPTMSIFDNVAAGLRLTGRRLPKSALQEIVERSLRSAHLWDEVKDRLGKPGIGLSGGQQQRLCIARSIAVEPEVLLMDEPASALDPVSTLAIEDLMRELKHRYTIVIVTHNMQQASRASDFTAFFNVDAVGQPGHLVEFDTTETIFSNPREQATEDYVSGRFG
jgi:phosphate transport system ATP-binding protein